MNVRPPISERLHRPLERLVPNPKLKFMEQCREVMRFKAIVASDGGNVSTVDSAFYLVSSQTSGGHRRAATEVDLAASQGHGRGGSAGLFDGLGGAASGECGHTESSVECFVISISRSVGCGWLRIAPLRVRVLNQAAFIMPQFPIETSV